MLICNHCEKPIPETRDISAVPFGEKEKPWMWKSQFSRAELDLEICLRIPEGRQHVDYHLHEQCLAELLVHFFTLAHYPSAKQMLDAIMRLEKVGYCG